MQENIMDAIEAVKDVATTHVQDAVESIQEASSRAVENVSRPWIWSGQRLEKNVCVPVPLADSGKNYMGLLAFAKVYSDLVSETNLLLPPPVTSGALLLSSFFFFQPTGIPFRKVCLSPQRVVEKKQYGRMLLSPFIHVDRLHFLTCATMLLPDAARLEETEGSGLFLLDFLSLLGLTQGLYVWWSWFDHKQKGETQHFTSAGTSGLSSVALAIKMVVGSSKLGVSWAVGTLPVPAALSCWVELIFSHMVVPEQNIRANLVGITAGLIRCIALEPAVKMLARRRKRRHVTDDLWLEDPSVKQPPMERLKKGLKHLARVAIQVALTAAGGRACRALERRLTKRRIARPMSQWGME